MSTYTELTLSIQILFSLCSFDNTRIASACMLLCEQLYGPMDQDYAPWKQENAAPNHCFLSEDGQFALPDADGIRLVFSLPLMNHGHFQQRHIGDNYKGVMWTRIVCLKRDNTNVIPFLYNTLPSKNRKQKWMQSTQTFYTYTLTLRHAFYFRG